MTRRYSWHVRKGRVVYRGTTRASWDEIVELMAPHVEGGAYVNVAYKTVASLEPYVVTWTTVKLHDRHALRP